jgi:chromosome segregation protein
MAHFLKRLELNGFKSFAGKTVLEFPSGITAIVGPNGSGKSNIVDSVRWLLGERDAKNLRGAKIDDLIFAGTAKRPRLGMATASLHFENKNSFFPVDFAEVSVVRQISRDGQSKYFLNKSEVLLRDLVDFLAKARLGSRGMIVVSQGNSDAFIRATPRERREMIEEILGLREYQLKKADAERRLKNSQINLDKVGALVEEILPHLRSLKRQTSRWERRGALEGELTTLEDQFFGSQMHDIRGGVEAVQAKIDGAKGEFAAYEKEKKAAEEEQRRVEASQPEGRKDIEKIKTQTQALLERRSQLQKELGRIEAQIEMGGSALQDASGRASPAAKILDHIKEIKDILASGLHGDLIEMQEAIRSAIEEINAILEDEEGTDAPKVRAHEASPALKAQFEKADNDLRVLEKEMLDLREREKQLEKNQEAFYHAFKAAVAAVEVAKEKIEKWETRNREHIFEKERLDLRREELERQIVQAGRRVNEFSANMTTTAMVDDSQIVERRIFKLRGDLASIGEIDEALMKEASETESRYEFLSKESDDLNAAVRDLRALIVDLTEKIKNEFDKSLVKINDEFGKFFELMFGGGHAKLRVEKPEVKNEPDEEGDGEDKKEGEEEEEEEKEEYAVEQAPGLEIELRLPRKKINSLEMLSGGERSLVGIAALFAMISVSPPPFLVLDEIDAALDERNARRFSEMLKEFSKKTQFIVVTHNRATMEAADILYGITLSEDGTSKILSLKLEAA